MRLLLAPLLLAALVVPDGRAVAAPPTCEGRAATIVGAPGQYLTGTAGDDVVVTAGASSVDAGAGDDLICATGAGVWAKLGPGVDVFRGGGWTDSVTAEEEGGRFVDDVVTGGGSDRVQVAGAGMADAARIDLGVGEWDALTVLSDPLALSVDAGRREIAVAGQRAWWWAGDVRAYAVHAAARVDFQGTDAPEALYLDDAWDGQPAQQPSRPGTVRLGGGDDHVAVASTDGPGQVLDGGPGQDTWTVTALQGRTRLDLEQRGATLPSGARLLLEGMERHRLLTQEVAVRGTARADDVTVVSCRADIRTRGGADRVMVSQVWSALGDSLLPPSRGCPHTAAVDAGPGADRVSGYGGNDRIRGGPGHDVLVGGAGDDRLDGGPGNDVIEGRAGDDRVRGGPGRDRCSGERRSGCEGGIRKR